MKGERGFRIKFGMTFWCATVFVATMLTFAFVSCKVGTNSGDDTPVTYSITIADGIEHGTISSNVDSAAAGTTITLTATPDEGYELEAYIVKDSDENEITVTDCIFIMPKSNVTVSATFKAKGQNEQPEEQKEEPTEEQKEVSGKYTIGDTTYTVKDGKVSVTKEDGTEAQVGEISKEGVITITEDDKTTVISVEKTEDGATTTTVKIETKDSDGTTVTKTYTGDVSTGTLVNKEDKNDSISVEKEPAGQTEDPNGQTEEPNNPEEPNEPEEPKKWTVTFVTNAESTVESQIVENEKKATEPEALSKTGYTFDGWFAGDKQFDFNTPITANVTLTAKWSPVSYKITYEGVDGATNPNTATTYTIESDDITLADATKTGFNFGGWKNAKDEAVTKIAKGSTGDIVLTATWIDITKPTFTVTFTVDGESTTQTVEENAKATKPADPVIAGYNFEGWANGGSMFDFETPITANIILIAQFSYVSYKITYAGIDGATNPNETVSYKVNEEITLSNASKTGYTFGGWKNAKGEAVTKIAKGTTGDITLTATWTPATNTAYKVLHYKQNAENDEYTLADTDNLTGTTAAQTSAQAKAYAHFTAGTVTQAKIAADGSTEVKIYYARETITFTLELAGGTLGEATGTITKSGKYGQSLAAVANPTRQNYTFSGWNTKGGTIPATFEESATYTALWTTASGITISIAPDSTINVEQEESIIETTTSAGSTGKVKVITLTAAEGFTGYSWRIDGNLASSYEGGFIVSEDGRTLTILKSLFRPSGSNGETIEEPFLVPGVSYQVTLSASKNGIPCGSQIVVTTR
ncbi:MAG: InlB B-repeat-containing protein [Treponema sp.]|nr:InlB B-repeat-containing protein [Treponema sp.]